VSQRAESVTRSVLGNGYRGDGTLAGQRPRLSRRPR
jgi:hypothetical protein